MPAPGQQPVQPVTARAGFVAETQAMAAFAPLNRAASCLRTSGRFSKHSELADLAAWTALGKRDRDPRLVHIQPDVK